VEEVKFLNEEQEQQILMLNLSKLTSNEPISKLVQKYKNQNTLGALKGF
jgi:hypothetical protein